MSRFTLSKLFTSWTPATTPPKKEGWYRTRTEVLTHSWWNGMAYFDGEAWWEFGKFASMAVRREVKVLQWQGLAMPFTNAIDTIRANMPRSPKARRSYERFITSFGAVS